MNQAVIDKELTAEHKEQDDSGQQGGCRARDSVAGLDTAGTTFQDSNEQ